MGERSAEELKELQEPNSMAGTSQLVRAKGPGFGGEAHARPADESNSDPEAEAFAEDSDQDEEDEENGE